MNMETTVARQTSIDPQRVRPMTAKQPMQPANIDEVGRFIRMNEVVKLLGLTRPTVYRMIARGDFPERTQLSSRCVGWWQSEVMEWINVRRQAAAQKAPHSP